MCMLKTILDIVRPRPRNSRYGIKMKLFHVVDMNLKLL